MMNPSTTVDERQLKLLETELQPLSAHLHDPMFRFQLLKQLTQRGHDKQLILLAMRNLYPNAFDTPTITKSETKITTSVSNDSIKESDPITHQIPILTESKKQPSKKGYISLLDFVNEEWRGTIVKKTFFLLFFYDNE